MTSSASLIAGDLPIVTGGFADGQPLTADEVLSITDPARPGDLVGSTCASSAHSATSAVAAAQRAFAEWSRCDPQERASRVLGTLGALTEHHEADAEILTLETGKIRMESKIDLWVLNHRFELACGLAGEVGSTFTLDGPPFRTEVTYHPLGVVTIIVPFNWPLAILAASLPYALVAGNTVVVKPPPTAPLATARVVRRIAESLPPGVLNVVTGRDEEIGPALVSNEAVAKVCFTGSVSGGRRIMEMASRSLTRVALELGGNDPALILDDALLDEDAIGRLFGGIFDSTGQICMAAKRVYVHRSRYDEAVDGLSAALARTVLGHGLDAATTMGPLHTSRQRGFVKELLDEARSEGAEVREFGDLPDSDGYFLRPSLVLDPDPSIRIVTEEQFGPTVPIIPFDDLDAAIVAANDTWAGLCASVWTEDPHRAATVGSALASGYTWVNNHSAAFLDERAPFGGVKRSGFGREMGTWGLREFMEPQAVSFPTSP